MSDDAKTTLRAYAVVGVARDRDNTPETWVTIKKVVYTREAAAAEVDRLNNEDTSREYFIQMTKIEPLS